MNLQYISDSKGKTTGVFIPISEWNKLKSKYKDIEKMEIPDWQKNVVRERLADYKKNPKLAANFDKTMDEMEKDLNV